MKFTKMHGAGNDYVYIDCFTESLPEPPETLARVLSHHRFGIGSDGLILVEPSERADARMRIFNADGSHAEMCGNGIRCVAKFIYDQARNTHPSRIQIESDIGVHQLEIETSDNERLLRVSADMGAPVFDPRKIPADFGASGPIVNHPIVFADTKLLVTVLSIGNPHCVVFVPEASDRLVKQLGPTIENAPRFPNRTNVEFVEILSRQRLRQRTWERGSGETLACGTGASAACVAGVLTKRCNRHVSVELLGGTLDVTWSEENNRVRLTGDAVEVFRGDWPVA